ncbi:MAG: hypothetical protein IT372_20860 [Polyangiaceae bacterium]|nr:hypothetical protein [Polyangiaceae bacterium]
MALERSIHAAQAAVPECVAVGYIDMAAGMLLAVRTVDSQPIEVLDRVSLATAELFEGRNLAAIEELFDPPRGEAAAAHRLQEILVLSDNVIHVFVRGKRSPEHAVVFVCRSSANVGLVLSRARAASAAIEGAL